MGLVLKKKLTWLYLILQYHFYIPLLIAAWWRGLIQNIQLFIPKFKTLNLYLKCLELNGLIFRCAEHSQVFQIPVGANINMHTVNWLQPQYWYGDWCIPVTCHRDVTGLEEINKELERVPASFLPSPNNLSFTRTKMNL